jgi:hypothetical protein
MRLTCKIVGVFAMVAGIGIAVSSMGQPGFGQFNAGALIFIIGMLNEILGTNSHERIQLG